MAIDFTTDAGRVRLLISDVQDPPKQVFSDQEIAAFLAMKPRVLRAAALALETIAGDQALRSKVIRTQDVQTNGAQLAEALLKHADRLKAEDDDTDDGDGFGFEIVDFQPYGPARVELTELDLRYQAVRWIW
jgi:hypothetical protein